MRKTLRLLATSVAVAGLLTGSVSLVSAKSVTSDLTFNVYTSNGGAPDVYPNAGSQVVVSRNNLAPKNQTIFEQCTKPADNSSRCTGNTYGYYYQRAEAGAPWYRVSSFY